MIYDPPGGWQFGFPKPYKPRKEKDGTIEPIWKTLVRDGYPKALAKDGGKHTRFVGDRSEFVEMALLPKE